MKRFFKILCRLFLFGIIVHFFQCNTLPIKDYSTSPNRIYKNIYVDAQFNKDQIKIIKEAAQEWEDKTHNMVSFNVYDFDRNYVKLIPNRDYFILFLECPLDSPYLERMDTEIKKRDKDNHTLGIYNGSMTIPTIFVVNARITNTVLYKKVVLHELGHALGLEHNEETTDAIMYHSLDKAPDALSSNDINDFCKKYICESK